MYLRLKCNFCLVFAMVVIAEATFALGFEETIRHELGSDFIVKNIRKIYYVASNGTNSDFVRYSNTITRMDDHLTNYFVKQRPLFSLKVYLFKDAKSYESFCVRSEEHTSELQSLRHLVCRLLLEKKKI